MSTATEQSDRIRVLREAFPREGMFQEKTWRLSPEPFSLSKKEFKTLTRLGSVLQSFLKTCDVFYRRSCKGSLPEWLADYLDIGKPDHLLDLARSPALYDEVPQVIRPDLILTETGFALTEVDNVPGGIGLTTWLNQVYSQWDAYERLIGGYDEMLAGFRRVLPKSGSILVSEESSDYRPEMMWLDRQMNKRFGREGTWHTLRAEEYPFRDRDVYRFFELFDLDNIPGSLGLVSDAAEGRVRITPPVKPYMEEKMWLALFYMQPLVQTWKRALRGSNYRFLESIIPYGWIMDPSPLPHHAVLPRLGIQSWEDMKAFSQTERDLVIKVSGFSDQAWGSRSVRIGNDLSQREWSEAIDSAIEGFPSNPHILQEFHKGRVVEHPYWNEESGAMEIMKGRVRLCPYYLPGPDGGVSLCGVLATICPADKKIIHGMEEAILVPCQVV